MLTLLPIAKDSWLNRVMPIESLTRTTFYMESQWLNSPTNGGFPCKQVAETMSDLYD